jgi:hypothetical protein
MRTIAKSRLLAGILCILLLCTTVPSTTSCESALGTGALVVAVIAVVYVGFWFVYAISGQPSEHTTSADPRIASLSTISPTLIEQRQDLVIRNELDCAYEVYVDGAYRCDIGPLAATSLKAGIGTHDVALYRRAKSSREPQAPSELHQQFEVLDDEGFAYAVAQYSY